MALYEIISGSNNNFSCLWVELRNELSCLKFCSKSATPFLHSSFPLFMIFPQIHKIGLCWILREKKVHGAGPALRSLDRLMSPCLKLRIMLPYQWPHGQRQCVRGSQVIPATLGIQGHRAGEGWWLLLNKLRNCCLSWVRKEAGARKEPAGICEDHVSLMVMRLLEGLGKSRHLPTPDPQSPEEMVRNRISGG